VIGEEIGALHLKTGGEIEMNGMYRAAAVEMYRVKLSGALNRSRAQEVTQAFRELAGQGVRRVTVDLEQVPLIDSRGLAALIAGFKLFGADPHNFSLVGLQDQPRLVLELTGFDRIFQ
jgi:anti-anti-sigma factor